eukprot:scaffold324133_cov22-Prasinocladus_malaysianus.AAC.1
MLESQKASSGLGNKPRNQLVHRLWACIPIYNNIHAPASNTPRADKAPNRQDRAAATQPGQWHP